MSSAVKTTNFGLNQWASNEYPKREDFVADNAAIDAQMKSNKDKADAAKAKTDKITVTQEVNVDDVASFDSNEKTISFKKHVITSSNEAAIIDWKQGNKAEITLTEDVTLSFLDPAAAAGLSLKVKQDATGGHVITFPNGIITPDKEQPAIGGGASVATFYGLHFDGSEYWMSWSIDYGAPSSYVTSLE